MEELLISAVFKRKAIWDPTDDLRKNSKILMALWDEIAKETGSDDGGSAALFLTFSGSLFSIGEYLKNCLGVGIHFKSKELLKIGFPTDVKIQDFATRGTHCVALTTHGCVFHWGGSIDTPKSVKCLQDECVVQVSSGEDFLMALSSNGQVWAWKGTRFSCYKISPREDDMLEADISPVIIKLDGIHRPIVLTEGGKLYLPGTAFDDTLPPFISLSKPVSKVLSKEKIVNFVCGKFRIFALSLDGALYTWNEYKLDERVTPEPIVSDLGRFSDLTAPINVDEVIVKNEKEKFFKIVKQYGKSKLWNSEELKLKDFKEYESTFKCTMYGRKKCVVTPVETSNVSSASRAKWLSKWNSAFNNVEESDVTFVVQGKMIYAHRMILSLQCYKLKEMMNQHHKDSFDRMIVPIENFSHLTFFRFMKFLYYGYLDIGSYKGNIELLKLVFEYDYKPLMELCQEILLRGIQEDNACEIFTVASCFGLKEMEKKSLLFINNHLEDMIKHGYYDGLGLKTDAGFSECLHHHKRSKKC